MRPVLQGDSNLPDGTKLIVTIRRKESSFQYETMATVSASRFDVGPLNQRGNDLNPGYYHVEIALAPLAEQRDSVREVIGKHGEKLAGALTRKDGDGRALRYIGGFQLGLAANPELDAAAREQAKISETRWWRKHCRDICDNAEYFAGGKAQEFNNAECVKTCVANPPTATR